MTRDMRRTGGVRQIPVSRPGARFYVTLRSSGRTAFLAGPYGCHMSAVCAVDIVRDLVREAVSDGRIRQHDAMMVGFGSFGTASHMRAVRTVFGRVIYRPRARSAQ